MNLDTSRKISEMGQFQEFIMHSPSPNADLTPRVLDKYTNFCQFEYFTLFKILSRPHALRSHNELKFIADFIKLNPMLSELSDINGCEYTKGLMRTASLEEYQPGSLVQQRGNDAKKIYIILQGRLGTIKNLDSTDMIEQMSVRKIYETLTHLARRQIKRFNKLTRKLSSWRDNYQRHTVELEGWEDAEYLQYFERHHTFADKVRCSTGYHTHTTVALDKTLLLSIDIKNVIYWLNHSFEIKLQVSFKLLRQHPCFACLTDQILESVIAYLVVTKASKGEVVYEQGTQADKIYFLQQGELKIEKACKLFIQNPNTLYLDRRKLMNDHEISHKQYLPYADFHLLYNYRPTYKNIEIGLLNPFCIFGEEEIVESRLRETTVRCVALKNTYFSIELKKLSQTLGDNYKLFIKKITETVKQKIKYRQNAFATTINLSNKKELKYFFEGDSPSFKNQKKAVKKINDKIKLLTDDSRLKFQRKNQTPQNSPHNLIRQGVKSERASPRRQQDIPPSFNSFNFNKLLRTKLKKAQVLDESSSEEAQPAKLFPHKLKEEWNEQKMIINNSHTWRLIRAKVSKGEQFCHKIGSYKYKIDFESPLIDEKHFKKIDTEMKRLQRDKRVKIYNLSAGKFKTPNRKTNRSLNSFITQR